MDTESGTQNTRQSDLKSLLRVVTEGKGKPLDRWEITALLETNGMRDVDARNEWNEADLFTLSDRMVPHVNELTYATREVKQERFSLVQRVIRNYIKGALFAIPMVIQIIAMVIIGVGIWSSVTFTLREATVIGLGTLLALATTGGISQIIGRKGLFYLKFEESLLASKVTKRLFVFGVSVVVLLAIFFTLFNYYFKLFPTYMYQLFFMYYLLLSLLFLVLAVFYMLESHGTIALLILLGVTLVYVFYVVLKIDLFISQYISIFITTILANLIAFLRLRRLEKTSESEGTLLPNLSSLFYTLYPYFIYGSLYFTFLILDRLLAWTTGKKYLPYFVWFNYPYEVGVDWALIPLVFTIALIEVFVYELGYLAFRKIRETKAEDVKSFNNYFVRTYRTAALCFILVGIFSIIIAFLLPYVLRTIPYFFVFTDMFFDPVHIMVFVFAAIGYVLLSWSLLNCIIFFAYSRHQFALKSIGLATLVNLLVGYFASRVFDYYFAVVGLTAGGIVFAVISTYYAYTFFKHYDFYYYSAY